MATREERAARNEATFRQINESIKDAAERFHSDDNDFVCECSDIECIALIRVTLEEYERVRTRSDHFAVVAGHEQPEIEGVVERTDRFLVVEKTGAGAAIADELDPRRADSR